MRLYDLSVTIRPGMVVYPGDPQVLLERAHALERGDLANVSRLDFGVHSGTHLDAPVHFFDDGAGAEAFPLDVLIGPCRVVDATASRERLDAAAIAALDLGGDERVLLKTRNSELWALDRFNDDFVSFDESGARALVELDVRLVGIDYLSIGDAEAHRVLLGAGVVPVEGLDLRGVEPGEYRLLCLPLKILGSDGAPARVVLVRD